MRTNIEIDDALMTRALELGGLGTKRATVEEGLRILIRLRQQERVGALFGKIPWGGDLDESRRGRLPR
jgi:Arc/MetJ family transcription regulator